jgi:hypothetical protein
MLVNTERIKFRSNQEVDLVEKLTTMLEGKVDLIKVRRQSKSFGAAAFPYKAKRRGKERILDLNLGAYSIKSYNPEKIAAFILSEKVQKFFSK